MEHEVDNLEINEAILEAIEECETTAKAFAILITTPSTNAEAQTSQGYWKALKDADQERQRARWMLAQLIIEAWYEGYRMIATSTQPQDDDPEVQDA